MEGKKTGIYHFRLTSHKEPMFRSEADINKAFNCLAEACCATESKLVAEAFMPSHIHGGVNSATPKDVIHDYRNRYSRYFNTKFGRDGRLGEREVFLDEMIGAKHLVTCLGYVIRQGMHHGLSATPFGYPHCSARSFFIDDLGMRQEPELIADSLRRRSLTRGTPIPDGWRMAKNGLLLREDVLDTSFVENLFVSPRNYLFQMNRVTDEKWIGEQMTENDREPITLEGIEKGVPDFDMEACLRNEKGRFDNRLMSDLELCTIIDTEYVPAYFKGHEAEASVYKLTEPQRREIANRVLERFRYRPNSLDKRCMKYVTAAQVRRCMLL